MEQDEEAICTISKDSNHISNQDLITEKARAKKLLLPKMNIASNSSQKMWKWRKIRKFQVELNKY